MMPTIRIDDDVLQGLKKIAEPFTDTPSSVIRRLLVKEGVLSKPAPSADEPGSRRGDNATSVQVSASSLTPQPVFETYLLKVLGEQFNGRGGKHEVTKGVIELMKTRGFIGAADLERVTTGETKAENTVAWARNALKERGLISRQSPRGVWELTAQGMERSRSTILPRRVGQPA